MRIWRRVYLITPAAVVTCLLFGVMVMSSRAAQPVQDLAKLTKGATVSPLRVGTTYGASLINPTPNLTPAVRGWGGGQLATHKAGKVRYESAIFFWHDDAHELDIVSGPAMSTSPAATLAQPRSRIPGWDFSPYPSPSPVKQETVAGRKAIYFDGTPPPQYLWTLVGKNPPELQIDPDTSFRMAALSVRGKTVVVVVRAPAASFTQFLPIAERLLATLRFPPS
jgi:hypothetical protein